MITIVFCGDLMYCPYIKRYTERLDLHNIEYEVLFWNRAGLQMQLPENYKFFDLQSDTGRNPLNKLTDFRKFRYWLKKCIKNDNPDKLIILSTMSGMVIADLLKSYKSKYIFDIRDYSYEHIRLFRKIESEIIKNSSFTSISSEGFKEFLPDEEYVIAHNFNRNDMIDQMPFKRKPFPINLVWNGMVRYFEFQKKYIDALANDSRFFMTYHGNGTDLGKYKKYCMDNNIKNVAFTGSYDNSEKAKLLSDAGILNNCYGSRDDIKVKYAVSNRFYDALIYGIPQLVEPGGYKSNIIKKWNVGIDLNANEDFADKLYKYYMEIDEKDFNLNCKKALQTIINEDDVYINKIDEFIKTE